jgi:putative two-component system response regulator
MFKVLIIDNDYINRRLLTSLLKKTLYQIEVLEAINGEDALEISSNTMDIELILLDVEMPIMDGAEFLKSYKKNAPLTPSSIIAVSSNDLRSKEMLDLGADAFILKPVTEEKLLNAILKSQTS